jgi:hypothetical protein
MIVKPRAANSRPSRVAVSTAAGDGSRVPTIATAFFVRALHCAAHEQHHRRIGQRAQSGWKTIVVPRQQIDAFITQREQLAVRLMDRRGVKLLRHQRCHSRNLDQLFHRRREDRLYVTEAID